MSFKSFFSSKLVIILLAGLLVFLGNIKYKQYKDQKAIEKEKQNLAIQADQLDKKNNELSQSLSYLNSSEFKERIARQQLNLKKNGEAVYNFTEGDSLNNLPPSQEGPKKSNLQKWWEYFIPNP